jgi:hypothetical protein
MGRGRSAHFGPDPSSKLRRCGFVELDPGRDYMSAVGVEGDSDCVGATRERGRLCLAFGSAAASFGSDFDLERRVRLGLGIFSYDDRPVPW